MTVLLECGDARVPCRPGVHYAGNAPIQAIEIRIHCNRPHTLKDVHMGIDEPWGHDLSLG